MMRWIPTLAAVLVVSAASGPETVRADQRSSLPLIWNVATDFRVAPGQANPNPDSRGNANIWYFLRSSTLAHTPASYELLPTFITDLVGIPDLQSWQGTVFSEPKSGLPDVSFNARTDNPFPSGASFPPGTVLVHPLSDRLAIVGWRSPIAGTVRISGGLVDRHATCGDGISWSIDKGAATLASGTIANGGSQPLASATGAENLENVAVSVGDFIFATVGPGAAGDEGCDSTGLDLVITRGLLPHETTTAVVASPAHSVTGQAVTVTATVVGADPSAPPTGSIQFKENGAPLAGPIGLDNAGHASATLSALGVGAHTIVATYQPDTSDFEGSDANVVQTVDKAATTTAVVVSPDPTVAGQVATFTAIVAAVAPGSGSPTGTVQFTESDGTPIGPPETLTGGKATLVASADAGGYSVRANYSGNADFLSSLGSVGQTVNRADTTTTISSDTNPVTPGGEVTFTVTVTAAAPAGVQPAGTIAILLNGEDVSGPVPLFDDGPTASGVDITFDAPTTPGSGTIAAAYSGDSNTNPSTSPTFVQTVAAPSATTMTTIPSPSTSSNLTTPVTTAATLNAMTARLTRALRRKGFTALNGTAETLTVSGPGTLTQRVYTPAAPRSAVTSKNRSVLIATGSRTFPAAGKGTLKLRLTAAGRRAIRRARALKVEIVTRFAPRSARPVIAVTRLTVKSRAAKAKHAAASRGNWTLRRIHR